MYLYFVSIGQLYVYPQDFVKLLVVLNELPRFSNSLHRLTKSLQHNKKENIFSNTRSLIHTTIMFVSKTVSQGIHEKNIKIYNLYHIATYCNTSYCTKHVHIIFLLHYIYNSESLSNTPFPIVRRVSLYFQIESDERGDRTGIIVMVALSANHYSTTAEIFYK